MDSFLCQSTVRVKTQLDTGQKKVAGTSKQSCSSDFTQDPPSKSDTDPDPGSCGCSASPSASVARVRLEQSRGGGSLTGCCRPEFLPASSTTTLFYTLTLCLSSTLLSNTIFCLSSSAICVKQHLTLLHTLLKQHIVPQAEHCASSTACRAPPVQVCVTHVHMIDIWPAGGGYQLYDNRNLIQKKY